MYKRQLYEGAACAEKELTLPHPGIPSRAFVLFPLRELFPALEVFGADYSGAPGLADADAVQCIGSMTDLLKIEERIAGSLWEV